MADADRPMQPAVEHIAQIARPRHAERAQRQLAFIDIGHYLAMAKAEFRLERLFKCDTTCYRTFDEDADELRRRPDAPISLRVLFPHDGDVFIRNPALTAATCCSTMLPMEWPTKCARVMLSRAHVDCTRSA